MKATSAKIELPEPQTRGGKLAEAQNGHPRLHVRTCDVANEADRAALVELTTSRFENLNVLVNNAGIQRDIDLTHGVGELVAGENEIRINLEAPIHLSGMLVPHLSKRSGYTGMPVYAASKAGIHAFTMALRK